MLSTKKEKDFIRSFLELSIISVPAWFASRFHFRRTSSLKIQNNSHFKSRGFQNKLLLAEELKLGKYKMTI
jgi:hypothetical protein